MEAMRGRWLNRHALLLAVAVAALFAASPASAAQTEFYGISQQAAFDGADAQAMTTARIQTDRFLLFWGQVEPTQDSFRWGPSDKLIGGLASHGVRAVPAFWGNPGWVQGINARPPIDDAFAKNQWQQFLKAAVARYGPGGSYWNNAYKQQFPGATAVPVQSWQIWNEPNLKKYFAPDPSAVEYARLLNLSQAAIRATRPNAIVVLAGMTGNGDVRSWNFLDSLYDVSGVKAYFDAVALHPYAPTLDKVRTAIENFRNVVKNRNDAATPLWITELAWGSAPDNGALNKGLTGQAQMLTDSFRMILNHRSDWNVQRLFWYHLRDPVDPIATCSFCDTAGLIRPDDTKKPSYSAYRAFSAETTPPTVAIASGPGPGSFTKDPTPTFTFSSNEAGVSFACRVDSGTFNACPSPYTPPTLANGPHVLYVRAIDAAGNQSTTLSRSFTVDTVAPTITAPGQTLFAGTQLGQGTVPVRLAWSGSDDHTPSSSLRFDLNERSFQTSWSPWSAVLANSLLKTLIPQLSPGSSYQFQARARDLAGNASAFKSGPAFTPRLFQETSATFTGTWKRDTQGDASGGSVRTSRDGGATATFSLTARSAAVVMPLRSTLGSARICLDPGTASQNCATVDLSPASGLGARMLVFARNGLSTAQHQVQVKVESGRVELDGIATIG